MRWQPGLKRVPALVAARPPWRAASAPRLRWHWLNCAYNTLLEEGEKAMLAAEQHVVTPALERVIEANTYLSGVGFEVVVWLRRTQCITA